MAGSIDPIRSVRLIRRDRPQPATDEDDASTVNVNAAAPPTPEPPPTPRQPAPSAEAHLIAQANRVRGLRGGPKVLEAARSAYLEAEWSGPNDRRARAGRITKTEA
jgi:hypothetical protein